MITEKQIENEIILALEEMEANGELDEKLGALKRLSNLFQKMKSKKRPQVQPQLEPRAEPKPEPEQPQSRMQKDAPISIVRATDMGDSGQKEMSLTGYMQKLGVNQSTAQALGKRIGQYLKQRKIPVAEVLQRLEALSEQEISLPSQDSKEDKEKASQIRKKFGADFKQARERIAQLEKELEAKQKSNDPFKGEAIRMIQQDLRKAKKQLEDYEKQLGDLKTSAAEKAKERGKQRVAARSQIRNIGANSGVIGKIITRFVSDNQQLLRKDAGLKAALEDPKKFAEMIKRVREMLATQLQRRGYEEKEITNLLESLNPMFETLREQRS
jgi:hypothetical protein